MAVFINSHFYSISFVNKLYWKSIEHDGASGWGELVQLNQLADASLLKLRSSSRGSGGAGGRGRNGLSSEDEDERRRRIRWEREGLGENCGYFFGKNKDGGKDGKPRGGTPSAPDLSDPPNSGARPKVRSGGSTSPQSSLRRGTGGDPPQSFPHIGGYNADLKTLRQSIQTLRENARKRRGESDGADATPSTSSGFDEDKLGVIFLELLGDPEVTGLYQLFLETAPKEEQKSLEEMITESGLQKEKLLQNLTRYVQ